MTLIERLRYLADNMPSDTAELLRAAIARIEALQEASTLAEIHYEKHNREGFSGHKPTECSCLNCRRVGQLRALVREQEDKP